MLQALTLIVCALGVLNALPDGPPLHACKSMRPGTLPGQDGEDGHTVDPQNVWPTHGRTGIPPYHIQLHLPDPPTYTPGERLHVSVIANQTKGNNFYKGVFMQARRVNCYRTESNWIEVEDTPIGTFSLIGDSTVTLLKTLDCLDIPRSAVSHGSPQFKTNETVAWLPPAGLSGNIVFKTVIVQEATVYWTNVFSKVLSDDGNPSPSVCGVSATSFSVLTLLLAAFIGFACVL